MNFLLVSVWTLLTCQTVLGKYCPEIYQRFSEDHTFCRVSTCHATNNHVSAEDIKTILKFHNDLRSLIATGGETSPRPQPFAANMMQMEWDNELAAVAQKHANLCLFQHDSGSQRRVENFSVGQNLFMTMMTKKIEWKKAAIWYTSEVQYFDPKNRNPFVFDSRYGHFSQVVWADTWSVGCGVACYRDNRDNTDKVLYTCNYGPAGNMQGAAMYVEGRPCSQCPKNTRCSNEYNGLCKSLTPDGPQKESAISSNDFILYCQFDERDQNECRNVEFTGSKPFETKKIYSGTFKTVVLNASEHITMKLGKAQYSEGICPFIYGSFGPNRAGDAKRSAVSIKFTSPGINFGDPVKIEYGSGYDFWTIGMLMKFNREMETTMKLETYPGAPPQYFNVKAFGIGKGKCPKF